MTLENGRVHVEFIIMRNEMESSTEAELGGLFENCQKSTSMRTSLDEMVHQQPPTSVATDNTAPTSIVTRTAKQKISQAIDMIFYWVRDRIRQKLFPSSQNMWKWFCRILSLTQ